MAAITLAQINTRVGHICTRWDSTFLTTHIQPKVLERANMLANVEEFEDLVQISTGSLTANDGEYDLSSDLSISHFGIPAGMRITTSGSEKRLYLLDRKTFDIMFPKPDETTGCPSYYMIDDTTLYLVPMPDAAYTYALRSFVIFSDANLSTVIADYMTEIAKMILTEWAAADVLRGVLGRYQEADIHEAMGDKKLMTYKQRYALKNEEDAGFISPRDLWREKNELRDDNWKRLNW